MLNPHYKNMGNLYGSEYWTYLLPRRVGQDAAQAIMHNRQPLTAQGALKIGLTNACLSGEVPAYRAELAAMAARLAADPDLPAQLAAKRAARKRDEAANPLAAYRNEEMAHMHRNFNCFDSSYHVARHHFVQKSLASWTPRHLALHRELGWKLP
jgi:putative two-component system hydrogenase maturation factor HypX/HoxX